MSKDEQRIADMIKRLDGTPNQRKYAVQVLIKIGPSVVAPTLEVMACSNVFAKIAAANVLGGIKDGRALGVLIDALKDRHQLIRYAVANALAKIGDPKAIPMLQEAAKEEEAWKIHPSLEALETLGAFSKPQPSPDEATSQYTFVPLDSYKSVQDVRKGLLLQTNVAVNAVATDSNNSLEYHPDKSWIPNIFISGSFVVNPPILAALACAGYERIEDNDDFAETDLWDAEHEQDTVETLISDLINGTRYSRLCAAEELYNIASAEIIQSLCTLLSDVVSEHYNQILYLVRCIIVKEASTCLEVPASMLQPVTDNWTLISQEVYSDYKNWTAPVQATKPRLQEPIQKAVRQNQNRVTRRSNNTAPPVAPMKKMPAGSGYAIPVPPTPPAPKPFALDMNSVQQKIAETAQVQELLRAQFDEDDAGEAAAVAVAPGVGMVSQGTEDGAADAPDANPFKSLDDKHFVLLNMLLRKPFWKMQDIEAVARPLGLMANGALERLNDMALDMGEDNIFEGDDPIEVNIALIRELLL